MEKLCRAVLFDALQKVYFPCQIGVHRRFCIIRALIGFEPDIDRLVGHFWAGRERESGSSSRPRFHL